MAKTVGVVMDEQAAARNEATQKAFAGVTIKDSAIDKSASEESSEDRKKRLNISDLPGHTYETEQIAKQRAEEAKGKEPAAYEYKANGFTVTEVEGENLQASDPADANKLWKVDGPDGFTVTYTSKRSAEIYVETHSSAAATLPATSPST